MLVLLSSDRMESMVARSCCTVLLSELLLLLLGTVVDPFGDTGDRKSASSKSSMIATVVVVFNVGSISRRIVSLAAVSGIN